VPNPKSIGALKMAGHALNDAQLSTLLASLEMNLRNLVKARDPQTVALAYELQNAIDNIHAELSQIGDPLAVRERANAYQPLSAGKRILAL